MIVLHTRCSFALTDCLSYQCIHACCWLLLTAMPDSPAPSCPPYIPTLCDVDTWFCKKQLQLWKQLAFNLT
jgi:hypothetical protein